MPEDKNCFARLAEALYVRLREQWYKRPATIMGCLAGVFVAILILIFGFWSILFVTVCGGIGVFFGRCIDKGGDVLENIMDSIPRDIHRWR